MSSIGLLYEKLLALRWPTLAGDVGDFPLYESLLAGCADRAARGGLLDVSTVPKPDEGTLDYVNVLRTKATLSQEETEFLAYFDLLEELRVALSGS